MHLRELYAMSNLQTLDKMLEGMVGPNGLEPLTSTVSYPFGEPIFRS